MKKLALPAIALILAIASIATGLLSLAAHSSLNKKVYARGGTLIRTLSERIDYANKVVDQFILDPALPGYDSCMSCGITAGGDAIAWYNKELTNLIPGHTAGTQGSRWRWSATTSAVTNMFATLYTDMNATSQGVTLDGYLGGLDTYATRQGYTFTSENTMEENGMLDNKFKTALRSGKLLSIFMSGYNITMGPAVYSGYDTVSLEEYAGAHIMTAYGYMENKYYNAQGVMFRQDTYLLVNTGFGSLKAVRLNSHITIVDCYILNIF